MTDTPIKYALTVGGSGHGISHYSKVMHCTRRAMMDLAANELPDPLTYNRKNGAVVGTLGHAFMDLHYSGMMTCDYDPMQVEFNMIVDQAAKTEAARVFSIYRERYPNPEVLGRVIATELELPEDDFTLTEKERIFDALGIAPFTCRIDLVTEMEEKHIVGLKRDWQMNGRLDALRPGIWLTDFKFWASMSSILVDQVLNSLQYIAYPLAFQAAYPELECKGILQLTLVKTKNPSFVLTVVPFPNQEKIKVLHNVLNQCADRIKNPSCNPFECVTPIYGGQICPYLVDGKCRRY